MPLYIRDDSVDDLAKLVEQVTGAKNKTEAVRAALQARLEAHQSKLPLIHRIQEIRLKADEIGQPDPNFDMKAHTDEMWDDA